MWVLLVHQELMQELHIKELFGSISVFLEHLHRGEERCPRVHLLL